MNRIVGTITHLGQHLIAIVDDREAYRPSRCPHCGRAGLWCHGHYDRKADRSAGGEMNPVPVPRYFCGGCEHTCSRLPACLAPRRWYDWVIQQAVLVLLLSGASMHECVRETGRPRSTVRRWWRWLQDRHLVFSSVLRGRESELGRHDGLTAFWRQVIDRASLMSAMTCLDQELSVP
jgi:transposase-like protein